MDLKFLPLDNKILKGISRGCFWNSSPTRNELDIEGFWVSRLKFLEFKVFGHTVKNVGFQTPGKPFWYHEPH
jgi:hypothetical protein